MRISGHAASSSEGEPYHIVERRLLGFDHGDLGALLIREWNLSQELEEAVRIHHRLDSDSPHVQVAAMIALGEEIASCTGSESEVELTTWESSEPAKFLDVSADLYAELIEKAHQLNIDPQFFA